MDILFIERDIPGDSYVINQVIQPVETPEQG